MKEQIRIAILGSGNGTNAQRITEYFQDRHGRIVVDCILYNRRDAYIGQRAHNLGVEHCYFPSSQFREGTVIVNYLRERQIDFVVLAGFLLLVPQTMLDAYPGRIVNIHPALLPKYGGQGMYGSRVHEAVVANREAESGITIHVVDRHYDRGTTLFQAVCKVEPSDTADDVAHKIHLLEQKHFPQVIEDWILHFKA
ncbi:MAG: formyltetrahydrofolate-dependent phosphoribosylglycinamide formyltransferase [bacterium P3]|nr:MAG: formyltetrahydrofolate-dependent phosphoribosylglycinamide formyltransferase [bacterium P3]KWW41005.1 MAG: formyltetrahydrofolate-dependent phosphoribosylglycinamide formyltransferase [bacterium F083]